ncbi:hypothetical protein BH11PSE10_BH11PSE10_04090 [soil metagenome]
MALPLSFDAALELEWRTLERRLRLLKTFGLIVLFVRDGRLAQGLKIKVAAWLAERRLDWAEVALDTPDGVTQAAKATLSSLFDQTRLGGLHLAWLEAHTRAGQPAWDAERRELLRRLNERRSRLEAELPGPFILLLPEAGMRDIATLAPDLWHIRIHTAELRFDAVAGAASLRKDQQPVTALAEPAASAALAFWRQQWTAWQAAVGPDPAAADEAQLGEISLWDGWKAVDECLASGRRTEAADIAQDLLALARLRVSRPGDGGTTALREYSLALDHVAEVAEQRADLSTALAHYEESLAVTRDLASRMSYYSSARRDLGIALSNVASTALKLERWAQAEAAGREALALFRSALSQSSDASQARRDLAGGLLILGSIAEAQGNWAAAQRYGLEALDLARREYVQQGPQSPAAAELAHAVLLALNSLAGVALALGDWSRAEALAEESQQLGRTQLQHSKGDAELMRDMINALHVLSEATTQLGQAQRAEQAFQDTLALIEALDDPNDDNPPNPFPPSPSIP